MRLHIVPASTGLQWARSGVRTFFRQPVAMATNFFLFLLGLTIAAMVPVIGFVLTMVLLPAATLGMMSATREAVHGRPARPANLVAAFRAGAEYTRPMLLLGALYAGGFLVALGISSLFDGGQFARAYLFEGRLDRETLGAPGVQAAMWAMVLLYLPLSMLFWHAPALVFWYRITPAKSLFFSIVACLRNVGAFTLYGIAWVGIFILGGLAVGLFTTLLLLTGVLGGADSPLAAGVAAGLMTGSAIVLAAMFFTSLYFTFIDCFVAPPPSAETTTVGSDD
ncbi:BPSS1780 family membrane protein [uncultured Xylophilus sp.]|uniref:BPSS1780 family membrane protein n=1 Tax=uncultured Xylophilus sp. TaxID=296832 RepID=UPI0025D33653|nr:BPSS1780 family membrane protein [uncultured Xylophilus sp.]